VRSSDRVARRLAFEAAAEKPTHSFPTLLSMLGHHKAALTGAIVFSILGSLMGLAQPMLINQIIESIGQPVGALLTLLIGLLVLSSVASGLEWFLLTRTAEAAVFASRR